MFLKSDKNYAGLKSIVLVTSEAGYLNIWTLNYSNNERLYGKFYASGFKDQSIFALTSNFNDTVLIVGDTKGFIYLWDISKSKPSIEKFSAPNCLKSWRCHDSTIVSCEYISSSSGIFNGELLITASTDWCCRIWTVEGIYIGSFGQETKWNLADSNSFQSLVNLKEQFKNNSKNEEEENEALKTSNLEVYSNE